MESLPSSRAEAARSETQADLKQEEGAVLVDPDTAGLPDAHDDPHKPRAAPAATGPCALKVLVSNNVAGSLIGKAGSAINDIQTETGARIKLSQANEFFPATQFRVVLITGTPEAVKHANSIVWEKISNDMESIVRRPQGTGPAGITGRITIPANAAGLVLGRQGVTVRQIIEMTGARIQLSNKDDCAFTQERVVSITGAPEACVQCVDIILDKLMEDQRVGKYTNLTTSYSRAVPAAQYGYAAPPPASVYPPNPGPQPGPVMIMPGMPTPGPAPMPGMPRAETLSTMHTIRMAINDSCMGLVLGRNGSTLADIQSTSRARIVVSGRNEFVPGTNNRTVTITGTPMAAETARYLIMQRLAQIPGAPPTSSPPSVGPAMEMNGDHHHSRGL